MNRSKLSHLFSSNCEKGGRLYARKIRNAMKINRLFTLILAVAAVASASGTGANELPWSQRVANAAIARWPDGRFVPAGAPWHWNYELGTLLGGMDAVWLSTVDRTYFNYIKDSVDQLVTPDGSIPTLKTEEHELDNILLGRQLLFLYRVTQNKRYLTAATFLYQQLKRQPRNPDGGFWHKQRYPNQMWLDGLYMAEPFYAEYASISHHPEDFTDITHQFVLMEEHARDPKTGLLYHGWDESKAGALGQQANRRLIAILGARHGLVHDGAGRRARLLSRRRSRPRQARIDILRREADAVARFQDRKTGLWYDVVDKPGAKGNYFESSASCMFVYAFAKGVRRGYLPEQFLSNAEARLQRHPHPLCESGRRRRLARRYREGIRSGRRTLSGR